MLRDVFVLWWAATGTYSLTPCNLFQVKGAGPLGPFSLDVSHHRNPPFFSGAKLELLINKDDTLMDYTLSNPIGAIEVEGDKVVVLKNIDGGKVTATDGDYSCEVTLGPFRNMIGTEEQDNWVHVQNYPVDFFSIAVQTVNGEMAKGEYYVDRSDKEIHLRSDASSLLAPSYNWFQVGTGAPADLDVDPNTSENEYKNANYVAPTLPQMLTAGQMSTIVLYWGTMFSDQLNGNNLAWTYSWEGGPRPYIDEHNTPLPYGTAGLVNLIDMQQTLGNAKEPLGVVLSFTSFKRSDVIEPIKEPTPLPVPLLTASTAIPSQFPACDLFQVKGAGPLGPFSLDVSHHRNPPFFSGAKLELLINKDDTLMDYTLSNPIGAIEVEGDKVVVLKNIDGGKVTATNGDYSCEVTLGPFRNMIGTEEQDNWVHVQNYPVDFFSTAVQTVNGEMAKGEYYVDRSDKEIHLRSDASSSLAPSHNWFQVDTGAPADLDVDPNTSENEYKNANYVAPTLPQMLTAGQMSTIVLYWGTMFSDQLNNNNLAWTYSWEGGPRPYIDEHNTPLPYGTAGLVNLIDMQQTLGNAKEPLGVVLSFTPFKRSDVIEPIEEPTPLPTALPSSLPTISTDISSVGVETSASSSKSLSFLCFVSAIFLVS